MRRRRRRGDGGGESIAATSSLRGVESPLYESRGRHEERDPRDPTRHAACGRSQHIIVAATPRPDPTGPFVRPGWSRERDGAAHRGAWGGVVGVGSVGVGLFLPRPPLDRRRAIDFFRPGEGRKKKKPGLTGTRIPASPPTMSLFRNAHSLEKKKKDVGGSVGSSHG